MTTDSGATLLDKLRGNVPRSRLSRAARRLRRFNWYNVLVYILLLNLAFIFLYPFIYMLVTSFKSYADLMDATVKWYPREFTPRNWSEAVKQILMPVELFGRTVNLPVPLFNSVLISVLATVGHVLSCSITAYGFSRFQFPGKNLLFVFVIATIIVPVQTIIVPQFSLYNSLRLTQRLALIVPAFFGMGLKGGIFIFLFRQFFLKISPSLEEAAAIDGCNPYSTYFRIILPTSGPVLLVSSILSIVWHWNDVFEPSIYITESKNQMLPQLLPGLEQTLQALQESVTAESLATREVFTLGVIMAVAAITVAPLVIMYFILQKRFVQSIDRTGLVE